VLEHNNGGGARQSNNVCRLEYGVIDNIIIEGTGDNIIM